MSHYCFIIVQGKRFRMLLLRQVLPVQDPSHQPSQDPLRKQDIQMLVSRVCERLLHKAETSDPPAHTRNYFKSLINVYGEIVRRQTVCVSVPDLRQSVQRERQLENAYKVTHGTQTVFLSGT